MSIKKRLILSNIAMIILPFLSFLMIEMVLGIVIFYIFDGSSEDKDLQMFMTIRLIGLLMVITLTNGLLTYFVSRSIIKPVNKLSEAAKEISKGNLDFSIETTNQDELGKLSETFEMMRIQLNNAKALQTLYENNRKELIASISHDLKTPMTSIKGYVRGILDGVSNTPEKTERYMETIFKKASDMDEMIDELFLYSKLDLDREPFHFERIDLHSYFADFIEELRFDLERDGGVVTFLFDPEETCFVNADREKLNRVVTNIIQNSFKYMDKEAMELSVQLKTEHDQVVVHIKDNGRGISEDAVPYIFDSFYRTDSSRNSSTGGSGLGLAIVKRMIEEHGGAIWAESKLGEGTSIFFTLKKFREE